VRGTSTTLGKQPPRLVFLLVASAIQTWRAVMHADTSPRLSILRSGGLGAFCTGWLMSGVGSVARREYELLGRAMDGGIC
jgi:hypothetical protein